MSWQGAKTGTESAKICRGSAGPSFADSSEFSGE